MSDSRVGHGPLDNVFRISDRTSKEVVHEQTHLTFTGRRHTKSVPTVYGVDSESGKTLKLFSKTLGQSFCLFIYFEYK